MLTSKSYRSQWYIV